MSCIGKRNFLVLDNIFFKYVTAVFIVFVIDAIFVSVSFLLLQKLLQLLLLALYLTSAIAFLTKLFLRISQNFFKM